MIKRRWKIRLWIRPLIWSPTLDNLTVLDHISGSVTMLKRRLRPTNQRPRELPRRAACSLSAWKPWHIRLLSGWLNLTPLLNHTCFLKFRKVNQIAQGCFTENDEPGSINVVRDSFCHQETDWVNFKIECKPWARKVSGDEIYLGVDNLPRHFLKVWHSCGDSALLKTNKTWFNKEIAMKSLWNFTNAANSFRRRNTLTF